MYVDWQATEEGCIPPVTGATASVEHFHLQTEQASTTRALPLVIGHTFVLTIALQRQAHVGNSLCQLGTDSEHKQDSPGPETSQSSRQ